MYYCKEFKSLSVLSLFEGELLGKVDKLYFDKKLKKLINIELIGEDGAKMLLPTKNIYHVGKNAITVKNNQSVLFNSKDGENYLAPIGSKAYSINGEFLGVVQELCFDEKYCTLKVLLENDKILEIEKLAKYGKNTMIFNLDEKKVNMKKFTPMETPKIFKTEDDKTVSTLPVQENVVPIETGRVNAMHNAEFLVGRKCLKDIVNFNNELLIKAQAVITKKALKEIEKFGKLRELMLYSK